MTKLAPIPPGLHSVTIAITLAKCAEAIEFYERAFGAEQVAIANDPSGTKVWHGQIRIGDTSPFVNDELPDMGTLARPVSLWVYGDDVDARVARAVAAGATPLFPPADMFWGDRLGKVRDPYGNDWTLAQRMRELSEAEVAAAAAAFAANLQK